MTYHTRNSGEQMRYCKCNSYERVQSSSHVIECVVLCVRFVTHIPNFSWYRLSLLNFTITRPRATLIQVGNSTCDQQSFDKDMNKHAHKNAQWYATYIYAIHLYTALYCAVHLRTHQSGTKAN